MTATESRSQHENRARALRRLREAIALGQRNTVDPAAEPPPFLADALRRNPGLRVSSRHDDYCLILQYVLDVLVATGGCVARTGASIGLSTSQLVRFLQNDPKLWAQTNRIRQGFNLKTLS